MNDPSEPNAWPDLPGLTIRPVGAVRYETEVETVEDVVAQIETLRYLIRMYDHQHLSGSPAGVRVIRALLNREVAQCKRDLRTLEKRLRALLQPTLFDEHEGE